jgi:hypothetical protein
MPPPSPPENKADTKTQQSSRVSGCWIIKKQYTNSQLFLAVLMHFADKPVSHGCSQTAEQQQPRMPMRFKVYS